MSQQLGHRGLWHEPSGDDVASSVRWARTTEDTPQADMTGLTERVAVSAGIAKHGVGRLGQQHGQRTLAQPTEAGTGHSHDMHGDKCDSKPNDTIKHDELI